MASIRESLSAALFRLEEPMNVIFSAVNLLRRRDPASASMLEDALDASRVHLDALREVIPPRGPETMSNVNLNEILRDVLDIVTPACWPMAWWWTGCRRPPCPPCMAARCSCAFCSRP